MTFESKRETANENWLQLPLAIVGMACRLPGGDNLEAFWDLLRTGGYGIDRLPDSFFDRNLYFCHDKGVRGKSYSDIGGLVADRPLDWDIMPVDRGQAEQWDPCHLILSEVAAKACIQAGYDPRCLPERRAGVYIGHSGGSTKGGELAYRTLLPEYLDLLEETSQWQSLSQEARNRVRTELLSLLQDKRNGRHADGGPMVDAGYAAGLMSRAFGLDGPHMVIDAACASSLVALALSAAALRSGQIEMAFVGGASINKIDSLVLFSQAQSCSAHGSRPFDAAADGLISSEGYVVLILKTLEKALASGDRIQAVIRGIGVSSDGRGRSLWAPRKEGQEKAIERAYFDDVTPDSVQLIEAHATSTQVGDATEMEALSTFYCQHLKPDQRIPVGSVKSNIGHTLETAGLAGLVKVVLAIQHGTVPPSINVDQLNDTIPWNEIPLFVPTQSQAWPSPTVGQPRRAAVNAFGIGGLNVHLVVDQYVPELHIPLAKAKSLSRRVRVTNQNSPIAVVGRGLVIPGALNVAGLANLAAGLVSPLSTPPNDRWRKPHHVWASTTQKADVIEIWGGFITDFAYDWRKHKVPPKQIAQANPVQFMLLEAAEQALREAGYLEQNWNRQRAAVIVGSVFGGDFGNALYAGLRLPELRSAMYSILLEQGLDNEVAHAIVAQYEEQFLKYHPALLDETGSFTSSTLASRLSKTFDLMGGAMAIDAGDASGMAALDASANLLRSGTIDYVLCATGQRAMDRASLERLALHGRLASRNQLANATPDRRRQIASHVPSEGVALVLLKRLEQAQADGDNILATIIDCAATVDLQSSQRGLAAARSQLRLPPPCTPVGAHEASEIGSAHPSMAMQRAGNLQAAQAIVDLIEFSSSTNTTPDTNSNPLTLITQDTYSGLCYCAGVIRGAPVETRVKENGMTLGKAVENSPVANTGIIRLVANSLADLVIRLNEFSTSNWEDASRLSRDEFGRNDLWRASLVVSSDDFRNKAAMLASQIGNSAAVVPLAEQGLFWSSPDQRTGKTAWIFSGQGSQSQGMLRELVERDKAAADALVDFDGALNSMGEPGFAELAWSDSSQLGENIWHTQASMLIADSILAACLESKGLAPDIVGGHSYGEFAAMLKAGCWDVPTALRATWHRCESIVRSAPAACGMLSVQAEAKVIQQLIARSRSTVSISHINTKEQTVVGGRQAAVAQFAQLLENEGVVSRLLAVPTAFHTPALAAAQPLFEDALKGIKIDLPRIGLLSSVSNRYVADPEDFRANLVTQLAAPLDFVSFVRRLLDDGVNLFVEVGPQQIVSRLIRQIVGTNATVVSTDHTKRGAVIQLLIAQACIEAFRREDRSAGALDIATHRSDSLRMESPTTPLHFDATERRRQRMRRSSDPHLQSARPLSSEIAPALHFDASQSRRLRNRQQTLPEIPAPDLPKLQPIATSTVNFSVEPVENTQIIESFLIDFVVEQTGYPAEIIELDWDIEADLGIDSIKKAQLFGELREFFDLESHRDFTLDRFRTLRDIVVLLVNTPGKGDWLERHQANGATVDSALEKSPPMDRAQNVPLRRSETDDSHKRLQKFLIDFVVEQTGYPEEIVDLDADLEADLGIDSIKKAQLFGELREMFSFPVATASQHASKPVTSESPVPATARLSLGDYRTLRSVLELLISSNPKSPSTTEPLTHAPPHSEQARPEQARPEQASTGDPDCDPNCERDKSSESATLPGGELDDLPACEILESEFLPNDAYRYAAWANLRAMVGRPLSPTGHDLGRFNRTENRTRLFAAEALGVSELSLMALDKCLISEASWSPVRNDESAAFHSNEYQMYSILEYCVPDWLMMGGGVPIGYHGLSSESRRSQAMNIELLTPGAMSALVMVTPSGVLHAAGQSRSGSPLNAAHGGNECQACEEMLSTLQAWIKKQTIDNASPQEFESAARALKLPYDWWVMRFDRSTAQRILVESRDSVVMTEKGPPPVSRPFNGTQNCAARLVFDSRRGALLLQSRLRLGNFTAIETQIPLDSHNGAHSTSLHGSNTDDIHDTGDTSDTKVIETCPVIPEITQRFVLRMAPSPQRPASGRRPIWSGAALVIGDNPVATQLEARLRGAQVPVVRWAGTDDPMELARRFDHWISGEGSPGSNGSAARSIRHLFLTTPCDSDARSTLDRSAWQLRRNRGLMSSFWLCQRWHQHVLASGWLDDTSLVAVTTMGGDFGLNGQVHSVEGGGLAGMLKSVLIESWVQGFRTFPIKVIDTTPTDSPAQIVDNIWQELSVPSFDLEVAYRQGERHVVRAIAKPIKANPKAVRTITKRTAWVCTGGARGITAYVAEHMAQRYQLILHLLGASPLPSIDANWRHMDDRDMRALKAQVMTAARLAGNNPVTAWQDTEKALEIDRNLQRFHELGIEAHYHQCDVSDREQVEATLGRVRELSGPIHGVLHGAGVGKDARFDRKQPEKVQQCIGAKVDGAWSLIEATWKDPLEAFIGFGSISGRFGANGHTDYSLANDMLCKQMDWLRGVRPEVRSIGFHWHAWGDIGMATKPETKLALEMIQMQFMPAVEGVSHLTRELESDTADSEVLITDDRYYRLFYSPDLSMPISHARKIHSFTPLISEVDPGPAPTRIHKSRLDPERDPFLVEHRLDDRPLLPIVIGAELLLEGARAHLANSVPLMLRDVQAVQGLRFYGDQAQTVKITTKERSDDSLECQLLSDFHARDGRLVQPDRVNLIGVAHVDSLRRFSDVTRITLPGGANWERPAYPVRGEKFYVGLPLQRLRGFLLAGDALIGKIIAPALIELAGGSREVRGWQLPSSAVDACLFAAGILAWQRVAPGSALPVSFGEIALGRMPHPGEACEVHVRLQSAIAESSTAGQANFDFTLYGVDNDVLVNVRDYRVAWLADTLPSSMSPSVSITR